MLICHLGVIEDGMGVYKSTGAQYRRGMDIGGGGGGISVVGKSLDVSDRN